MAIPMAYGIRILRTPPLLWIGCHRLPLASPLALICSVDATPQPLSSLRGRCRTVNATNAVMSMIFD
jgi:hypothetical protein